MHETCEGPCAGGEDALGDTPSFLLLEMWEVLRGGGGHSRQCSWRKLFFETAANFW